VADNLAPLVRLGEQRPVLGMRGDLLDPGEQGNVVTLCITPLLLSRLRSIGRHCDLIFHRRVLVAGWPPGAGAWGSPARPAANRESRGPVGTAALTPTT